MDNITDSTVSFVNPATQTPLFVAEWITCAYPVNDLYASSPRYLYYALLVLVFLTQWHPWLANVFLGVVGTYAGIASIEAFILISHNKPDPIQQILSIPFIDPSSVQGNATLSSIPNLITNRTSVQVSPAASEFDIDALLAITVTGYLMMLPMHCWSSAVRANRARHVLILLWNALMFAGTISSILMWPTLFDDPLQYRFCYPTLLDGNSVTSNGHYGSDLWRGDWNDTIWTLFSNFSIAANLDSNCFYPCFNTSQVLRRANTLVADTATAKSPRTNTQLFSAGFAAPSNAENFWKQSELAYLMYIAIIITTVLMMFLLLLVLSPMRRFTRVPINRPKELFWKNRREIFHALWTEFKHGSSHAIHFTKSPMSTYRSLLSTSGQIHRQKIKKFLRFWLDILAIIILFFAMVLTPATIVVFVIFIEWYIHRDLVSSEAPQQVGQWSTYAGVLLILISALLLRLRYSLANENELKREIVSVKKHLGKLERLLKEKEHKHAKKRQNGTASSPDISSDIELQRTSDRQDSDNADGRDIT